MRPARHALAATLLVALLTGCLTLQAQKDLLDASADDAARTTYRATQSSYACGRQILSEAPGAVLVLTALPLFLALEVTIYATADTLLLPVTLPEDTYRTLSATRRPAAQEEQAPPTTASKPPRCPPLLGFRWREPDPRDSPTPPLNLQPPAAPPTTPRAAGRG